MGTRIRTLATIGLAIMLTVALVGCAKSGDKAADKAKGGEPVKVGAILSLTGTYAGLGESEKNAIELEVKRINDAGGINGRPIEVIVEDDGTDEAKAVAAASKLIEQDEVVAIIGATGTGQTMATRAELQRSGIPQVSMAGGTIITGEFDRLVFQTPWSNKIVVPFVLDAIKTAEGRGGPLKLAVVSDSGGYGKDGLQVIKEEVSKRAASSQSGDLFEIVADETFNAGDADMSAQVTRIKKASPDVVLLWTAGKEGAIFVKNARDLGLDAPLYGGSGQARLEFVSGAGDAAEGFTFGTGRSLITENWSKDSAEYGAVADFAGRYEDAYGESPDIFAGHAFDAMAIVVDSLERAGADAGPAELRDAIEETKDLSGFGGNFTYSANDHNGLRSEDLALYEIEGGVWKTVK